MKIIFTAIITSTLMLNGYAQNTRQWEVLNEGEGYFDHIDFVSDEMGFMVTYGNLLKTVDGGDTWNFIAELESGRIYGLNFVNGTTAWYLSGTYAVDGYICKIMKSIDGGITWANQKEFSGLHFRDMQIISDSTVYLWEDFAIISTKDGGQSWIDISPNEDGFTSLWFFSPDSGIVISSSKGTNDNLKIYKTFDGGITWNESKITEFQHIDNLYFTEDSIGYFIADYGYLYTTTDTFKTWTKCEFEYGINSFTILDKKTIVAINTENNLIYSTDSGLTWCNLANPTAGSPDELFSNSVHDIYVISQVGGVSSLWKTSDLGNNWKIQIFSYPFTDVFFLNEKIGFLCVGWVEEAFHSLAIGGNIFFTNNGGMSWKNDIETGSIETFFFTDNNTGYLLSSKFNFKYGILSTISKSRDSGENWFDVYESIPDSAGYSFYGKDLCFLNEELGWSVGEFYSADWDTQGACILETIDRSENWHLVWRIINTEELYYSLNSLYTCDSTAWAVGNSGIVVKYTSQDQWQLQPMVTDLPLNRVFFSDEQHGWISGGYWYEDEGNLILLRTSNGGEDWEEISNFNYIVNDIYFADSLHGWVVGQDTTGAGMILESQDGGRNWNTVTENLSAALKAIHFKNGYGWAVGDNGLILRTEDGTTWIDQNSGKTYPDKFYLSQNCPNPFNPSTIIKFSLPRAGQIRIEIYNSLGQKVKTILNERMLAGEHEIEFEAQNLASGVYYYQIKAGEFKDMKKMVLIK